MALALASSQTVASTAADNVSLVSSAITVANGDILVVKFANENAVQTASLPTGGGQTWTQQITVGATNLNGRVAISTCTVTGAPGTVTVTQAVAGTVEWHSMIVERWTGGTLPGSPVRLGGAQGSGLTGSGAPNATSASVVSGSVISWVNADFAAIAPAGATYRSSAAQDGIHDKSTANYVAYYAWQTAGSTGAQTVGMTVPSTQNWNIAGIEIQDAGAAATRSPIRKDNRAALNRGANW